MFVIEIANDRGFVGYVKSISSRHLIGFSITQLKEYAKTYKNVDLVMDDIDSCARSSFGSGYYFSYVPK